MHKKKLIFIYLMFVSELVFAGKFYRISSLEFTPEGFIDTESEELNRVITINLNKISGFIRQAKSQGSQMIVLPEYAIVPWSEDDLNYPAIENSAERIPMDFHHSCDSDFAFISITKELSCLAKKNAISVTATYPERKNCTEKDPSCPKRGYYLFNTMVSFHSNGKIAHKYRKINLYDKEYGIFNPGSPYQYRYFVSDFGVGFGTMICLDILHTHKTYGIKNWIHSVMWNNNHGGSTKHTATKAQAAWSLFYRTNLISSSIGKSWKTTGSGIYAKGWPLKKTVNPADTPQDKLMTATLWSIW